LALISAALAARLELGHIAIALKTKETQGSKAARFMEWLDLLLLLNGGALRFADLVCVPSFENRGAAAIGLWSHSGVVGKMAVSSANIKGIHQ
jgi:hypothetical protein